MQPRLKHLGMYQLVTTGRSGVIRQYYKGTYGQCRARYYGILQSDVMPEFPGLQWLDVGRYLSVIETKDLDHQRVALYMLATC
jgi:hypothetical protein